MARRLSPRAIVAALCAVALASSAAVSAQDEPLQDLGRGFHYDVDETSLTVGPTHACALHHAAGTQGGYAVCWGDNEGGQLDAPEDVVFIQLSVGSQHTCGVAIDQKLHCWGSIKDVPEHMASESYLQVSSGMAYTCAVAKSGHLDCFGSVPRGPGVPKESNFVAVSCGHPHACAIRKDGTLYCWGLNIHKELEAPPGQYVQVTTSQDNHACAIEYGTNLVKCWGLDVGGSTRPPEGVEFLQVTAGHYWSCGVKPDGLVQCWGKTQKQLEKTSPHPEMQFLEVSGGHQHMCGITGMDDVTGLTGESDDEPLRVVCWGRDHYVDNPPGPDKLKPLSLF